MPFVLFYIILYNSPQRKGDFLFYFYFTFGGGTSIEPTLVRDMSENLPSQVIGRQRADEYPSVNVAYD